jgi:hypothetical protein
MWTKLSVSNSNTIYCSLVFANPTEVQNLYNFLWSKENVATSSRRLKADSCQTHQHKTNRLTPHSSKRADRTIGVTTESFAFLATTVATVRTQFQVFSPHRTNGVLVQSSVIDSGHYIWSRRLLTNLLTLQVLFFIQPIVAKANKL